MVPGLAGKDDSKGTPEGMAAGVRALLAEVPEGGVGLAVSHTPFVERAMLGLTGREPSAFAECEGIRVTLVTTGLDVGGPPLVGLGSGLRDAGDVGVEDPEQVGGRRGARSRRGRRRRSRRRRDR